MILVSSNHNHSTYQEKFKQDKINLYCNLGQKKHFIAVWKFFLPLLALQQRYLDFNDLRVKDGRWKLEGARHNRGQVIIICLHLLLYPLLPIDTANGIASLCHSKSHFCSCRLCLCWQSERMRERKNGRKRADRGIFQHGFLSISMCLSKWEAMPGSQDGWRVVRQGLKFECEKIGGDELLKRYSMLL